MEAFLFLIPVTIIIVLGMLVAFFWTLKNKQYDDLDGAASRILFDDEGVKDVAKKEESE
jgi:cbb3-type cytochrome oxidase maturation protein